MNQTTWPHARGRHCPDCVVGWYGCHGDTCWACGHEGADGWINTTMRIPVKAVS